MTLKVFYFLLLSVFFLNTSYSYNKEVFVGEIDQDNTVLIKKIKARMSALTKQREKLKLIKKWTPVKEKAYISQIGKFKVGLKKLGYKESKELNIKQQINALQKQLKFLNNNKANLSANKKWSPKKEKEYRLKAGILIDSIIKMRINRKD